MVGVHGNGLTVYCTLSFFSAMANDLFLIITSISCGCLLRLAQLSLKYSTPTVRFLSCAYLSKFHSLFSLPPRLCDALEEHGP